MKYNSKSIRRCRYCDTEYTHYGQKQNLCRECRRKYDRAYHKKRSPDKKAKKIKLQHARAKKILAWFRDFKESKGCTDCGVKDFRVLQVDHLPGYEKSLTFGDIGRKGYSKKIVLEEMKKCEVVCANCHSIRTYQRRHHEPEG